MSWDPVDAPGYQCEAWHLQRNQYRRRLKLLPFRSTARSALWKLPSRFPESRIADHAQATSAATARVTVVAIGWKPKGIARPQELLLINRADLERAGDTQDELLGPDLVRPRAVIGRDRQLERQDLRPMRPPFRQEHLPRKPRLGRKGSTLARE